MKDAVEAALDTEGRELKVSQYILIISFIVRLSVITVSLSVISLHVAIIFDER